jgi:DNA-binding LacI/PurR family transcriptional regulator
MNLDGPPMPTVKDVAREAGVSVATVSRVLMNGPHVTAEKRQRVLEAIRQLDYRPDQVARSLRRRRSNLIALVVSTIENPFFTEVARAAEQTAHRHGYNLIISNTDERLDRERDVFATLSQQLVAGVILAPAPGDIASRDYLFTQAVPTVLVNRLLEGVPCPSIVCDDEGAAFESVNELVRHGRQRFAAITGLPDASTTIARTRGFRRALQAAGLPVDPELLVCGDATIQGGYRAARELMSRSTPPDALFVENNVMTQGTVLALQDLGLRWPDDVDIAGFGVFSHARLYRPPLTLVAQPTHAMGERAVELLVHRLQNSAEDWTARIVLPNRVVTVEEWERTREQIVAGGLPAVMPARAL